MAALHGTEHALDLGCGDGRLTAKLRAGALTAADVSSVALKRASGRLRDAEIALLEPDAPLPFVDSEFELVLCAETIEHVRDVQLFPEATIVRERLGPLTKSLVAAGPATRLPASGSPRGAS